MRALFTSRAFLAGVVVAIGVGVLAMVVSVSVDLSARDAYKTQSVRL
jgi:hypothetical protein